MSFDFPGYDSKKCCLCNPFPLKRKKERQLTHDGCIAEDYTTGDGEEKAYFTNVESAWLKDSGNIFVELRAGLALSGRVVIMPKRETS